MITPKLNSSSILFTTILITFLTIITTSLFGQFRDTRWGMTSSEVSVKEGGICKPLIQGANRLFCTTETIDGLTYGVFYDYSNKKLYKAGYTSAFLNDVSHATILNSFKKITKLIGEKYGKNLTISHEKTPGSYPKEKYRFEFTTGNTIIKGECELNPESYAPHNVITIEYSNKNHNSREVDKSKF